MKTNLFLIFVICMLNYPVVGRTSGVKKDPTHKSIVDTLVIQDISKEVYMCTCKPNTCNPAGDGQLYFQGKYKEDEVKDSVNYKDCDERFLIHWNLSKLPAGIQIIEAKMELYCMSFSGDKKGQLIYETITEPWKADIGYNKKPSTSIDGRILSDWPEPRKFYRVDITGFVQNWYANKIPNYGLMGSSIHTETTNSAIFYTSKYPDKKLRPKMIIVYRKE
jgi:hypothetical protein